MKIIQKVKKTEPFNIKYVVQKEYRTLPPVLEYFDSIKGLEPFNTLQEAENFIKVYMEEEGKVIKEYED